MLMKADADKALLELRNTLRQCIPVSAEMVLTLKLRTWFPSKAARASVTKHRHYERRVAATRHYSKSAKDLWP